MKAAVIRQCFDEVPISPSTMVSEAVALMDASGQISALVMEGDTPVGVVTAPALRGDEQAGTRSDVAVHDVMDLEVVHIDPSADLEDTLRTYREAAWQSIRRRRSSTGS